MLWGLSHALDLLSEYEKVSTLSEKKTLNILLLGSTDGRHILKTISAFRRHSVDDCQVNFFIMDIATEFVARQLLLFTIALEPEDRLGIQEKARLWMEIYGNTLLRPVTAKYLISKAVQLIHVVTNKDYQKNRLPLVDLDFVKYKEIDQLENIFKYWIHNKYSIAKIWDINLRKSLGIRYDAREGVFDWDYNMKIREIEGGTRVCASEYKFWRKTEHYNISHLIKVNFFVMDSVEMLVRQMLLLTIALEPSHKLGPLEKSRIWMEVYGNTRIRSSTAKYAISKLYQLRLMANDRQKLEKRIPLVDLSLLRYSDLDNFDEVTKYYQNNKMYAISRAWDGILRIKFENEYDYRFTYFDLDYCAKLVRIPGGHRVCKSEYIHWRNTGIAFTWLETEYSIGNPTLAVGIGSSGDNLYSLGYWGDMESGPFFAFGTDSEEKQMLEVRNDVNVRRATDITERNLQRMFHELEHGSPPTDLYTASIDLGLVMMKPGNVDVEKDVTIDYEPDRTPEDYSSIPVPNCKVFFLPSNAMEIFPTKVKYKEFFDIAFVAQNFFKFLNEEIMSMMKSSCCLVIETRKFVINLKKDTGSFGKEVRKKLNELGWKEVKKYHFRRDDHALFRKNNETSGSEQSIEEQNHIQVGNITDGHQEKQALGENISEELAQLNLEDTLGMVSNALSGDSGVPDLVCPEKTNFVDSESAVNTTEMVSSDTDEDTRKKMEDEESANIEKSCTENESVNALSEEREALQL